MASSDKDKYPALRIIAAWYKVFGYLVGAILGISAFSVMWEDGTKSIAIGMIVGAVVFVILSMAVAEIIQVFLDSESNTRRSAEYLKELLELQTKSETPKSTPKKSAAPSRKPHALAKKATASKAETIKALIKNLRNDGLSPQAIAEELQAEAMPTLDGKPSWNAAAVDAVLSEN